MRELRLLGAGALAACLLACPPVPKDAPYRTVVIFGDTQDLVAQGRDSDYADFAKMVGWVVGNRERENIDFVLHVGDIIHAGYALNDPAIAEQCEGARPDPRAPYHSACRSGKECLADLPPGCFRSSVGQGGCYSCARSLQDAQEEWRRFRTQWRRLEEARIPYAIVRGSHDNLGAMQPGALPPPGYRLYYGPHHFESLGPWSGYLESRSDDGDVSQAWRFRIGEQPVLVVGLGERASGAHLDWAERVLRAPAHAELPAILLTHQLFNGIPPRYDSPGPAWLRLVVPHPDRFFMAVWGHVAPGDVDLLSLRQPGTERDYPLLRIRSNWQAQEGRRSYMSLVRFHRFADGRDEVEVAAFSPLPGLGYDRLLRHHGDTQATFGSTWLLRRPFSITRDPGR